MDIEYDNALSMILDIKSSEWARQYVGVDIRIRPGEPPENYVFTNKDELPEGISDDDIARLKEKLEFLKEKLELLKKIEELMEKLKNSYTYYPYYPYEPPYINPWVRPYITWCDESTNDNIKINWITTGSDGNKLW